MMAQSQNMMGQNQNLMMNTNMMGQQAQALQLMMQAQQAQLAQQTQYAQIQNTTINPQIIQLLERQTGDWNDKDQVRQFLSSTFNNLQPGQKKEFMMAVYQYVTKFDQASNA